MVSETKAISAPSEGSADGLFLDIDDGGGSGGGAALLFVHGQREKRSERSHIAGRQSLLRTIEVFFFLLPRSQDTPSFSTSSSSYFVFFFRFSSTASPSSSLNSGENAASSGHSRASFHLDCLL